MCDDDIEYVEEACPKCGAWEVLRRDCNSLFCDDGYVDESEDDPINYMPGECLTTCEECGGHGCNVWCKNCGWDLLEKRFLSQKCEDEFKAGAIAIQK
jgi:hypothetical protein